MEELQAVAVRIAGMASATRARDLPAGISPGKLAWPAIPASRSKIVDWLGNRKIGVRKAETHICVQDSHEAPEREPGRVKAGRQ